MRRWLARIDVQTLFIEPGSPWENGYIESFNGRLRDEHLNRERFDTLLEAQVLIEDWRIDYNCNRPTPPTATSHPVSSPKPGSTNNQHSRNRWTSYRGPLKLPVSGASGGEVIRIGDDAARMSSLPGGPPYTATTSRRPNKPGR